VARAGALRTKKIKAGGDIFSTNTIALGQLNVEQKKTRNQRGDRVAGKGFAKTAQLPKENLSAHSSLAELI